MRQRKERLPDVGKYVYKQVWPHVRRILTPGGPLATKVRHVIAAREHGYDPQGWVPTLIQSLRGVSERAAALADELEKGLPVGTMDAIAQRNAERRSRRLPFTNKSHTGSVADPIIIEPVCKERAR